MRLLVFFFLAMPTVACPAEAIVADDGSGFDPSIRSRSAFPRFGLAIMRERAESIGGTLEIDTEPKVGTRVRIRIPATSVSL